MARDEYLFTSESVTEGHPDKIADQISDAVLDCDPGAGPAGRVACETLLTTGLVVVAGEITTSCYVDIPKIVARDDQGHRLHPGQVRVRLRDLRRHRGHRHAVARHRHGRGQPRRGRPGPDVRLRLPRDRRADAAADHARPQLVQRLASVRKNGELDYLRPDGKSQVSVRYVDGKPVRVETVVVSTQHGPDVAARQDPRRT